MAQKVKSVDGTERKNHKYLKREWKNGKWQYWYKDPTTPKNLDMSKLKGEESTGQTKGKWTGKTASWVSSYRELKNRRIGSVSPASTVSEAKNSKSASSGRAAVSKIVKTKDTTTDVEPVVRAQTTSIDMSDSKYNESTDKIKKELAENNEKTEKYYKEQFENEKNKYKEKLLANLSSQFGDDIPEGEKERIDAQVEEYTKTLWDQVYKPMMDRVVKANEHSTDQIMRTLKKLYEK